MAEIIEIENLTKKFGDVTALENVNLSIGRGKIYGIVGRNGSGKTVLFKLITGYLKPTAGRVIVSGKEIGKDTDFAENIGIIIENPGFLKGYTGFKNLAYLAGIRNVIGKEEIRESMVKVGLDPDSRKKVGKYSLGMKQRLGIAQAIMENPEILILDEPMNSLDPVGIHETRKYLLQLCREKGATIFISSHVLNEIEQLADVIGVINKGKLLEEIDFEELNRRRRKFAEFEVSDVNKAALLLERAFQISDYAISGNNLLRLYEKIDLRADINSTFVKEGITVTSVNVDSGKLEDYFTELVGGEGIG